MFVRSFFLHFHLWTIINANINLWGNSSYHHRQYICQTLFANIQYVPSSLQQSSTSFPDFHAQSCCTLYNLYNISSGKQTLFEYVCDCSTAAHCKPVLWHKKIEPRYETVNCGFGLCGFRTILALLAGQFTDLINLPVCYECHLITVTAKGYSYNLFIQQWNSQKIRGGYYTILSLIPFNLCVTDHNLSLIKSFPLVLCLHNAKIQISNVHQLLIPLG